MGWFKHLGGELVASSILWSLQVRPGARVVVQEINIKLWRNADEKDWSVEVGGKMHEHVSTETVDELVEYVLVAAQQALLEPEAPSGSGATPIPHLPTRLVSREPGFH
jgi:3-oxoacyl-(acyl-carrier-protein) synthase